MTDFESFRSSYEQHGEAVAKANALNRVVVFDALAAAGITAVTVHFDGEGDSGQIDDITAHAGDRLIPLPATVLTIHTAEWNRNDLPVREQSLSEAVEHLCYGFLEQEHGGWENNDGAYGEFHFDVGKRTIELEFNGRFSDVTTDNHTL